MGRSNTKYLAVKYLFPEYLTYTRNETLSEMNDNEQTDVLLVMN